MQVMSVRTGHSTLTWDQSSTDELLEELEAKFDQMLAEGYTAAVRNPVKEPGKKPYITRKFDPQAEEITFIPQMAGG